MGSKPTVKRVLGEDSWQFASRRVEAYLTRTGGHLGPVTFDRRGRKIAPLATAPWAGEKLPPGTPPIIRILRGDFFCLPFGGNTTPWRGERHPVHGETANAAWKLEATRTDDRGIGVRLSMSTRVRRGHVRKMVFLPNDHDAVYQRHVVTGMSGPMNFGHHAMVRFPDQEGAGLISTSRFTLGQVFTEPVELPANRGYSILKPGAVFKSLDRVPTITGENADLSRYPARRGYEDLVQLVADDKLDFAWTAVAFPKHRFAWFALKDPRVLRSTIFWISNGGRHYAPWNGRFVNVMGLEEVTSNFHPGLAESAGPNAFSRRGIATHAKLSPQQPLVVPYIFGVVPIPPTFGRVKAIEAQLRGAGIVLRGERGSVRTPVDLNWLQLAG
jgi:hypothetical protein